MTWSWLMQYVQDSLSLTWSWSWMHVDGKSCFCQFWSLALLSSYSLQLNKRRNYHYTYSNSAVHYQSSVIKLWIKINMSLQCMLNATVLYTTTPNCLSRQRSVARSTPEAAGLVFCSDSESAMPRGGISLRWKRWGKHNNKDKLWTIIICYFSRHSHVIQMYIYWNTRHMKSPCKHGKLTSEPLDFAMLKHCDMRYTAIDDVIPDPVLCNFHEPEIRSAQVRKSSWRRPDNLAG